MKNSVIVNPVVNFHLANTQLFWTQYGQQFNHRVPKLTTAYWKPNYKDLYGNLQ